MFARKIGWSLLLVILLVVFAGVLCLAPRSRQRLPESTGPTIVATNFAAYDFIRAILGNTDRVQLIFLLGPGKDAHTYDPTPRDITAIEQAALVVYVGGEMEPWATRILETLDAAPPAISVTEFVSLLPENTPDEAQVEEDEEAGGFDDHVWTSPANAIAIIRGLVDSVCTLDPDSCPTYQTNAASYIGQIQDVDAQIREIMAARRRERLVFADRMPFAYFLDTYDLRASAAFSGCSSDVEPSPRTIAALEDRVVNEQIPVVLYIELSDGRVASLIAADTGAQARQIQTLHNISQADFAADQTWVSLMTRNLDVLREALL